MALSRPRLATPDPHAYPTWESRVATEADVRWLAPRLAVAALDEIEAMSKFQPISALLMDLPAKLVVSDNRRPTQPDAILYIHPDDGQPTAGFWCAVTERLAQSEWVWSFTSYVTPILDHFNSLHPTLHTLVDARNGGQMELVERLGFKHFISAPFGRREMPFHFYKRNVAPCAIQ